ncbi:preprotein translocase subunit SecG [Zooshikella marina]|uniref:preprotein translocase subunit SecG n=1 Tax=Zooshikella ganghwensis TaxID=202772 RepID=UPI000406EF73|nr:preprotein translocase subunit SecG [Zooshikella ganghwensis]MBU2707983.1 preprotein translocase subunit SecG [Zooshikella ganghwensis]
MDTIILIVHVLAALALVGLVLLQQGKGAEAGASFGGGASQTVFGSQGSGNFLTKLTSVLATAFFVTSFTLAMLGKHSSSVVSESVIPQIEEVEQVIGDAPVVIDAEDVANDAPGVDEQGQNEAKSAPASEANADQVDQPAVNESEATVDQAGEQLGTESSQHSSSTEDKTSAVDVEVKTENQTSSSDQ